jgi:hypothetical protein
VRPPLTPLIGAFIVMLFAASRVSVLGLVQLIAEETVMLPCCVPLPERLVVTLMLEFANCVASVVALNVALFALGV